MKTFKVKDGDIVFNNTNNIELINGSEEIAQSIERILTTNIGEWFLNAGFGLDYDAIRGKGKNRAGIELAIREAVFQDGRVTDLEITKVDIDNRQRKLSVAFNATVDGEAIERIEVKI